MTTPETQPKHRIAFVCVQNAGRSQMATAFAERERARRNADAQIDVITGGTDPGEHVHEVVVEAMRECDINLSDRTPREVSPEELQSVDLVITMGCSASEVCPATWNGENRNWELTDPHGKSLETVREIRDEIERNVAALFDELLNEADSDP